MLNKIYVIIFFLCFCSTLFGQKKTEGVYHLFDTNVVVAADLGYNAAPIAFQYPFRSDISKLKYRNNMRAVLGLGISYKWLSLRIGITLPGHLRSTAKYGTSKYFDFGGDFTVKNFFFDIDLHIYRGYAIKNGYRWNSTLNHEHPNEFRKDIGAFGLSFNTWYFRSSDVKMQPIRGKTAHYVKNVNSWYVKTGVNIHTIEGSGHIVPAPLIDTNSSKTSASSLGAFDVTAIPGYIIIRRIKQFQVSAMAGLGVAIQTKYYTYSNLTRTFIGLAPRYDVLLSAGYNNEKVFLMLVTDIDNKSIRFGNFKYQQSFYNLKIVGGYRLTGKHIRKKLPWL